MSFFHKHKVTIFDHMQIEFIDKSDLTKLEFEQIIAQITSFIHTKRELHKINNFTIYLVTDNDEKSKLDYLNKKYEPGFSGSADNDNFLKLDAKLFIFLTRNSKSKEDSIYFERLFFNVLYHEIIHIYHFQLNQYRKRFHQKIDNLNAHIREMKKIIENQKLHGILMSPASNLIQLRVNYFLFIDKCFVEGAVKFYEYFKDSEFQISEDLFNRLYGSSISLINEMKDIQEHVIHLSKDDITQLTIEPRRLNAKLIDYSYSLGFHLFYTLYYSDMYSLDEILKMHPIEFVKNYEKVMQKMDKKPIFSYNSNEGIMDYQKCISEWGEMMQRIMKSNFTFDEIYAWLERVISKQTR